MANKASAELMKPAQEFALANTKVIERLESVPVAATFEENVQVMEQEFTAVKTASLAAYWDIGRRMYAMTHDQSTYGQNVIGRVAEILGCQKTQCNDMRKFFESYQKAKQVQQLESSGVSWSHAIVLSRVPAARDRQTLVKEIKEKKLSSRDLSKRAKSFKPTGGPAKSKTKKGSTKAKKNPVSYFAKLETAIKKASTPIKQNLSDLPAMVVAANNPDQLSESDYEKAWKKFEASVVAAKALINQLGTVVEEFEAFED